MRIDCHNHVMPSAAIELIERSSGFPMRIEDGRLVSAKHPPIPLAPGFSKAEAKLDELREQGIDGAVISMNPPLFGCDLPIDLATALCRASNEGMARFCECDPARLHWMAHVPLQDPDRAAAMLREAVDGGCVGVEICSLIGERRPDADDFTPFWTAADELRVPVFVHPGESNPPYPGMHEFFLQNVIGNLLETTIAVERFICSGLFDRFPRVRVLLPHAGGYFPYQVGRLRHAQTVRPELASRARDAWEYRNRIFVDTLTHDPQILRCLVDRMDGGNVVLGTDLPTPMADRMAVGVLEEIGGPAKARRIAETNAVELFSLG